MFFMEIFGVNLRTKFGVCSFSNSVDKEASQEVAYKCMFCPKERRFCPTVAFVLLSALNGLTAQQIRSLYLQPLDRWSMGTDIIKVGHFTSEQGMGHSEWPMTQVTHWALDPWPMWPMTHGSPGPSPILAQALHRFIEMLFLNFLLVLFLTLSFTVNFFIKKYIK